MAKTKTSKMDELVAFLKAKTPTLFDRDPVLTGDVVAFAEEIIKITK